MVAMFDKAVTVVLFALLACPSTTGCSSNPDSAPSDAGHGDSGGGGDAPSDTSGGAVCTSTAPTCLQDLGGGCCGDVAIGAACSGGRWTCPGTSIAQTNCLGSGPSCGKTPGSDGGGYSDSHY